MSVSSILQNQEKVVDLPSGGDHMSSLYTSGLKRVCDLSLAILLLPILAPVILVLALIVKKDGGPGFFGHTRIGRNGAPFKCWKVRTMVQDADVRLKNLLESDPKAREEWQRDQKLRNDPRITRLGEFLRKTSLDELPQIWNVLRGEMSFVGPRPVTEEELTRYGDKVGSYCASRPGITGLWQVSGRNELSYDERVDLDHTYSRTTSFPLDCKILVKTAGTITGKTGM